jgi:hypothetical protein
VVGFFDLSIGPIRKQCFKDTSGATAMSRIQKGMNVHFHLGRLGKILVIDEQEQFALVESYNSHEQYAVPLEEIEAVEAQLPLSLESSRY